MPPAARPDPHRDPIGPFLHYLMAECGLSPNTLAAYRSDIVRFSRWRKQHAPGPLADLDIGTLTGYVDYLARSGLAPEQHRPEPGRLSTFYRFLIYDGRLSENVAKLLVAPAVWDRLPTVLGPVGRRAAARRPDRDTTLGRRDRAALETLYATGCRASEVVGLRPGDLDLAARLGAVHRQGGQGADRPPRRQGPRGADGLPGPRPPRLLARPSRDVPNVFVTRRGRPLSRVGLWRIVKTARPGRRPARRRSARTPSGTASPPTSWPAGPTSASSRRCSATPRSPRPRFTRGSS